MERVCFLLQVRPDRLDEYRARHREVWPEMLDALREAGWRNYSLFLARRRAAGRLRRDRRLRGRPARDGGHRRQRALAARHGAVLRRAAPTTRSCAWRRSSTLPDAPRFAAADLGAESGRVVVGALRDGRVELDVVHRFANRAGAAARRPALERRRAAAARSSTGCARAGRVDGVGVDAWGVDYGLLDDGGRLLGLPYHHRDARTADMVARAFERVPRDELYAATGIQTMAINTAFQLLADEGTPALDAAARMLLIPDLLGLLAQRRGGQRDHRGEHHRPARRADRRLGARRDRGARACRARLFGGTGRARHDARPAARCPRRRRRAARARRRGARHRLGLRRRAGRRRRRRDPLQRNLVAARSRADRARARAGGRRRQPDQRARRRRRRHGC